MKTKHGYRLIAFLIILVSCFFSTAFAFKVHRHRIAIQQEMEDKFLTEATYMKESIENYFDTVHTILNFMSLHEDVLSIDRRGRDYLKTLADNYYARDLMSEIYIIERDFDGSKAPFMTFEYEEGGLGVEEVHDLESEKYEYEVQIGQIQDFEQDAGLKASVSDPVPLCVDKTGLVYSVPIRSKEELIGIVAGMLPLENISEFLESQDERYLSFLIDESENIIWCNTEDFFTRESVWRYIDRNGVKRFFSRPENIIKLTEYNIVKMEVNFKDNKKWYVGFVYFPQAEMISHGYSGTIGDYNFVFIIMFMGVLGALLMISFGGQKIAKEALKQSMERFELVVNSTDDGVWDWNIVTGEYYQSSKLKKMLGFEDDEVHNRYDVWESLIHPDDRERVMGALKAHLENRAAYINVKQRLRVRNGDFQWFSSSGQAIWDKHYYAVRMAGSMRMLSEAESQECEFEYNKSSDHEFSI